MLQPMACRIPLRRFLEKGEFTAASSVRKNPGVRAAMLGGNRPRMRAIRALPGQDYRPSGAAGEITIQSGDFALIAELVALDGFRMARRTGKLDVLTCVDDADGTDTHRSGTART